jgi:DNA-binding LacI/PurR family transcriptional regulator
MLRGLQESGIRVPREVSVVGYDDMPDSSFSIPPLTTLRQDYEGIEKAAVNNLMAADRKDQDNNRVLLKCPLVIRGSTRPAFQGKR